MSIRPNPATIRPLLHFALLCYPTAVSLYFDATYTRSIRAKERQSVKYQAIKLGRQFIFQLRYPAISGLYPATQFNVCLTRSWSRNTLPVSGLRQASSERTRQRDAYPATNAQPVNVRKCRQTGAELLTRDAVSRKRSLNYGQTAIARPTSGSKIVRPEMSAMNSSPIPLVQSR